MYTRRSWREKLDNPSLPKVVAIPVKWQKRYGTGGVARQAERLRAEGHRIVPGRGKRPPRVALPIQSSSN